MKTTSADSKRRFVSKAEETAEKALKAPEGSSITPEGQVARILKIKYSVFANE